MPPTIALILCTIFVLWLLYIERKQSPDVSFIVWLPTIWILSIASKPLGIWFGSVADASGGSPLDRLFQSSIICLGLIILFWRKTNRTGIIKDNIPLFLLLGYMLVSIVWSDDQFMSFRRWVRQLPAVIMALILLTEKVPRQALESLFRRTIYILIPFSLLLIKYYRYLGVEYGDWSGGLMWIGVTTQKNSLGGLCITSIFFIIWSIISRWGKRDTLGSKYQTFATIIIFIISLWLLKGPGNAYSATAIAALAFGLVMLFVLFWLKKRQIFLSKGTLSAIIVFIIIFGFTTFFTGGATIGGIVGTLGRDSTLTGRTEVWASLVPVAMNHPILGHGFGSFWTQETKKLYEISGSHSGYLDIFLELGIFGIILITIFFMNSVRKARELQIANFDWSVLWICFLTMILIENVTESSISSLSSYSMAMIVFLTVATYINPRQPQHAIPGDSDQTQILIK